MAIAQHRRMKLTAPFLAVAALASGGCYHYQFLQAPPSVVAGPIVGPGAPIAEVTYTRRVPTWVNGFVGTGTIDTRSYCAHPLRTELKVTATDALLSAVTLLIYTPHTLYVTCPALENQHIE
jgi:hypothetical protein